MNIWFKTLIFLLLWLLFSGLSYGIIFILYPESYSGTRIEVEDLLSSNYLFLLLNQIALLIGTFSSIFFVSKFIDKQKPVFLKSMFEYKGVFEGILIGLTLILACILLLAIQYKIKIEYIGINLNVFYYLIIFFIVAVSEETMIRGFIFNNLLISSNKYVALIISSLIFAIMHLLNSSINIIGILNLFLSGVIFALLFLKRMNLSIPIGVHFCWNFFQGPIFGFSISGFVTQSIFKIRIISGAQFPFVDFGLEGSIILTIVFIFYLSYLIFSGYKKKEFTPLLRRTSQ